MRTLFILLLALSIGCNKDRDRDGDGVPESQDCNDEDATIYPGAFEYCDGVDHDCDGEVLDDDAIDGTKWYADFDGDSFGDPSLYARVCEQPSSYVDNGDDCDDTRDTIFPGANEVCNSLDDDCDAVVDDSAGDMWFTDGDGDTYGDPESMVAACDGTSGVTADNTDCDDTLVEVNPGEDEVCDGLDNDCDGGVDVDALDAPTWYDDADLDGYGDPNDSWVDCLQPPGYVENADDCDDGSEEIHPAASEYCDGVDNDCDTETDEDDAVDASTWYKDSDKDGYGDPSTTELSCNKPTGHVDNDGDCDDTDADLNAGTVWYADADADGYGDASSTLEQCAAPSGYVGNDDDCDDADAATSPSATETCDEADNDCDGSIDESVADAPTWHPDSDGDGYGSDSTSVSACDAPSGWISDDSDCDDSDADVNPTTVWYADSDGDDYGSSSSTTTACEQPSGYAMSSGDCDDSRSGSNPGATEYCNSYDDDCDGTTDESSAADATTWYADSDGDGYGNVSKTQTACSAPTGYVADKTDCDDTSATYNPKTTWYRDADGDGYGTSSTTKTQCSAPSGYVITSGDCDDSDKSLSPATVWYVDADADGYGGTTTKTQCSQPTSYVATSGDCDDSDGDSYPGGLEVCDSADNDCDGSTDGSDAWWNDNWGYRVPITVTGGSAATEGAPVLVEVNFKSALSTLGVSGSFDEDSVRVVLQDCDLGQPELPSQFLDTITGLLDAASHTDASGEGQGTVAFLYDEDGDYGDLEGLSAGESVELAIYFGTTLDGLPAPTYYTGLSATSTQLANDWTEANFDRYAGGLLDSLYFTNSSGTLSSSLADQSNVSNGNGMQTSSSTWLTAQSSSASMTLRADGPVVAVLDGSASRSDSYAAYSYTYTWFMFAGRPEVWMKVHAATTSSSTAYYAYGAKYAFWPWRASHSNVDSGGTFSSTTSGYAVSNGTWGFAYQWYEAPAYGTSINNVSSFHVVIGNDATSSGSTSETLASGTAFFDYDIAVLYPFSGSYSTTVKSEISGLISGVSASAGSPEAQ